MKIERIDENTIKCYISLEEMEQYQVEYTDFLSRTEKAQELMHEIIRQAQDEVDYHPPKLAFEMQIMMVPEQGMVLTFSEKEPFDITDQSKVDAFLSHLKDFVGKLSQYQGNMKAENANKSDKTNGNRPKKESSEILPQVNEVVFVFAALGQVMDFADILPAGLRVDSALYTMGNDYFLHMTKGRASYEKYSRACVQALEFADIYRADKGCDEILKEHGECLISEKALKRLRK